MFCALKKKIYIKLDVLVCNVTPVLGRPRQADPQISLDNQLSLFNKFHASKRLHLFPKEKKYTPEIVLWPPHACVHIDTYIWTHIDAHVYMHKKVTKTQT